MYNSTQVLNDISMYNGAMLVYFPTTKFKLDKPIAK